MDADAFADTVADWYIYYLYGTSFCKYADVDINRGKRHSLKISNIFMSLPGSTGTYNVFVYLSREAVTLHLRL